MSTVVVAVVATTHRAVVLAAGYAPGLLELSDLITLIDVYARYLYLSPSLSLSLALHTLIELVITTIVWHTLWQRVPSRT